MFWVLFFFSLFMFSFGVVVRFEICKAIFSPLSVTVEEEREVVYVLSAMAGVIILAVLASWLYSLAMLISILPGIGGVLFGEAIYFGWERIRQEKEDAKYRDLFDPMI